MLTESHRKSLGIVFEKSRRTVSELRSTVHDLPAPWSLTVCAGAGVLLGDLYMSVENILRLFIEGVYKERIAKDDSWHRHLVDAGNRKGLLPSDVGVTLNGMRRFRHRLIHGYGIDERGYASREYSRGDKGLRKSGGAHQIPVPGTGWAAVIPFPIIPGHKRTND